VEEYILTQPLHCPLGAILFGDVPVDVTPVPINPSGIAADLQRMRTTDCVDWTRWQFERPDHLESCARVQYGPPNPAGHRVLENALPGRAQLYRQWKKKTVTKPDESGDYKFLLGRSNRKNVTSPLTAEGQVTQLSNGGWRVYWKNKRSSEEFSAADPDTMFEANMALGWFFYGRMVASTEDGCKVGVPVFHTDDGRVMPAPPSRCRCCSLCL